MITLDGIGSFIFAFGLLVYWCGAFFILYHLIRFGVSGQPKKIAVLFLGGSLFFTMTTMLLFSQVDFNAFQNVGNLNLFKFNL